MAWSVPTYAGEYMLGSPSLARTAMFEICRAVNERQTALGTGVGLTTFYKADGTLASNVSFADMENIPVQLGASNLERARAVILTWFTLEYFTTTSGGTTVLTKALAESAIGTDLDAPLSVISEARYWQALQDTLDLMIYARRSRDVALTAQSSGVAGTFYKGGNAISVEAAWDIARVASGSYVGSTAGVKPIVGMTLSLGIGDDVQIGESANKIKVVNPGAAGTITNMEVGIDVIQAIDLGPDPLPVTFNAGTLESINVDSFPTRQYFAIDIADWDLATDTNDIEVSLDYAYPTDSPFTGGGGEGSFRIEFDSVLYYFDIASELTDQA